MGQKNHRLVVLWGYIKNSSLYNKLCMDGKKSLQILAQMHIRLYTQNFRSYRFNVEFGYEADKVSKCAGRVE